MTLGVGTRVGAYEILAPLGAGGMGQVFRARDTKLGRDVAVKVLPDEFLRDEERLDRFRREARLLAQLNHINVATLHGLEEDDGYQLLVMELVEGETLAERIAHRPLPVDEAVPLFLQIAAGLEAAHEKGIVHRDLKPANIKIGADGKAKILDFGLAKALSRETPTNDLSQSPTLTRDASATGVLLGTAPYMSPEQARGKPVDKRADIWAFGCCLYEALTGRATFLGETVSDTLAAILEHEPSWDRLPRGTPPSLRRLLRRCLQKDVGKRLHDAGDVQIELEEALTERDSYSEPARTHGRSYVPLFALGALIAGALAAIAVWRSGEGETDRLRRSELQLYPGASIADFDNASITVSRDGSRIAYAAVDHEGTERLYVREMDQFQSTPVPGTEGNPRGPFFAPDGERLGYYDSGLRTLKQVSLRGGRPTPICEAPGAYRGGSWGDDDTIVMSSYSLGLLRGSGSGSSCETIAQPDGKDEKTYYYPQILPGDEWVLYTVGTFEMESYEDARIALLSLRTAERRTLLAGGTHARYASSGHIVYASAGSLVAVPFDIDRLEITGSAVRVVDRMVTYPASGAAQYDFSNDGLLAYLPGAALGQRELVWVDRTGAARPIPLAPRKFDKVQISPGGERLALEIDSGNPHIWVYDLARENLARLTFVGNNEVPIWTPDGRKVAFQQFKEGGYKGMWKSADGIGDEEELVDGSVWPRSWLPDGSVFAYEKGWDIWMLPLDGNRTPKMFLGTRFREDFPRFSPDGARLAYTSDESGHEEVYLTSYPDGASKLKVSQRGGTEPVWNPKGGELFYREGRALMSVAIASEPNLRLGEVKKLFDGDFMPSYDVRPDGEAFLMIRSVDEPAPTHINIVSNWFSELNRLVPTDN